MFPAGDVLATIVDKVDDRSARGIAAALNRMITAGDLPIGTRLPTVRDLARELRVSPTTVSEAWQSLAAVGAIEARGRSGSFVRAHPSGTVRRRYRDVTEGPGHFSVDLSGGTPDPALLPDLTGALADVARQRLTRSYVDDPVLPALGTSLRARWPFRPEAMTVVDGAQDALDRIATVLVRLGDRVVVENPGFPPLFDLLDALGADVVAVPLDEHGIVPDALAAAVADGPVAVFLQPRAHNPTGVSMTESRARELAKALRSSEAVVVEDDHHGDIAQAEAVSLGRWLPDRTVLVRSFSKSHGPDLRLAAVGGAAAVVEPLVERRLLGPGWSSRLLQAVLRELLEDPGARAQVAQARDTYTRRRVALVEALRRNGIDLAAGDGINLWLPVAEERRAQVTMAAAGIGVAPGHPFVIDPTAVADHLRVTVGLVADGHDALAARLTAASGVGRSGPGRRPV
jgi:DNA-binding transcriptional MocR family regulator